MGQSFKLNKSLDLLLNEFVTSRYANTYTDYKSIKQEVANNKLEIREDEINYLVDKLVKDGYIQKITNYEGKGYDIFSATVDGKFFLEKGGYTKNRQRQILNLVTPGLIISIISLLVAGISLKISCRNSDLANKQYQEITTPFIQYGAIEVRIDTFFKNVIIKSPVTNFGSHPAILDSQRTSIVPMADTTVIYLIDFNSKTEIAPVKSKSLVKGISVDYLCEFKNVNDTSLRYLAYKLPFYFVAKIYYTNQEIQKNRIFEFAIKFSYSPRGELKNEPIFTKNYDVKD